MKKDLFTTSLLARLICLLMPAKVMAQTEVDGLWYEFNASAKTAAVASYQGTKYEGDITIPPTVKYGGVTYSVTSIEWRAFDVCSGLTSITIPKSLTSIGYYAFKDCI